MISIISHKENAIKTVMRYHFPPIRMDKLKILIPNFDEDMEQMEISEITRKGRTLHKSLE